MLRAGRGRVGALDAGREAGGRHPRRARRRRRGAAPARVYHPGPVRCCHWSSTSTAAAGSPAASRPPTGRAARSRLQPTASSCRWSTGSPRRPRSRAWSTVEAATAWLAAHAGELGADPAGSRAVTARAATSPPRCPERPRGRRGRPPGAALPGARPADRSRPPRGSKRRGLPADRGRWRGSGALLAPPTGRTRTPRRCWPKTSRPPARHDRRRRLRPPARRGRGLRRAAARGRGRRRCATGPT